MSLDPQASPAQDKKAKPADSHGQESHQTVTKFGSPHLWKLTQLPGIALRMVKSRPLFFLGIAAAQGLMNMVPQTLSYVHAMLALATVAGTLTLAYEPFNPDMSKAWTEYQPRLGTLFGAQILFGITLMLAGVGAYILSGLNLSLAIQGNTHHMLLAILIGAPFCFMIALPQFLCAVVLDCKLGVWASIALSVRLFCKHLPGNLAMVLFLGLITIAPTVTVALMGAGEAAVHGIDFLMGGTIILSNMIVALRYLQLKARHPEDFGQI